MNRTLSLFLLGVAALILPADQLRAQVNGHTGRGTTAFNPLSQQMPQSSGAPVGIQVFDDSPMTAAAAENKYLPLNLAIDLMKGVTTYPKDNGGVNYSSGVTAGPGALSGGIVLKAGDYVLDQYLNGLVMWSWNGTAYGEEFFLPTSGGGGGGDATLAFNSGTRDLTLTNFSGNQSIVNIPGGGGGVLPAVAIPQGAFADVNDPMDSEFEIWLDANSSDVVGQPYYYNRPNGAGSVNSPEWIWWDNGDDTYYSFEKSGGVRAHVPEGAVSPAIPGSPTESEVASEASPPMKNRLAYYTGTDTDTDPVTHVYWIDGDGVATLIERPIFPAIAIPAGAFVDPDNPLEAEFLAWLGPNGNNAVGQPYYFNRPAGSGTAADPDYIWMENGNETFYLVKEPGAGGGDAGFLQYNSLTGDLTHSSSSGIVSVVNLGSHTARQAVPNTYFADNGDPQIGEINQYITDNGGHGNFAPGTLFNAGGVPDEPEDMFIKSEGNTITRVPKGKVYADSTLYVDAGTSDGQGTREEVSDPFPDLPSAAAAAIAGDTIIVRPGAYTVAASLSNVPKWYYMPGAVVTAVGNIRIYNGTCHVTGYGVFKGEVGVTFVPVVCSGTDYVFQAEKVAGAVLYPLSMSGEGLIDVPTIENGGIGVGINIVDGSPRISFKEVRNVSTGIQIGGSGAPVINGQVVTGAFKGVSAITASNPIINIPKIEVTGTGTGAIGMEVITTGNFQITNSELMSGGLAASISGGAAGARQALKLSRVEGGNIGGFLITGYEGRIDLDFVSIETSAGYGISVTNPTDLDFKVRGINIPDFGFKVTQSLVGVLDLDINIMRVNAAVGPAFIWQGTATGRVGTNYLMRIYGGRWSSGDSDAIMLDSFAGGEFFAGTLAVAGATLLAPGGSAAIEADNAANVELYGISVGNQGLGIGITPRVSGVSGFVQDANVK